MEPKVKGVFLKSLVDVVKKQKGPNGLERLRNEYGQIDFRGFSDYPLKDQARLNKIASKIIFGSYSPQAEYEFGRLSFKTYLDTIIGRTMFALIGADPLKIAKALPKILGAVMTGVTILIEEVGPLKVKITMQNIPFHIRHYEGACAAAAEHFGYKAKILSTLLPNQDFQYLVEWYK
jgi:uncharacterized protein (TIGR02265 family)